MKLVGTATPLSVVSALAKRVRVEARKTRVKSMIVVDFDNTETFS